MGGIPVVVLVVDVAAEVLEEETVVDETLDVDVKVEEDEVLEVDVCDADVADCVAS